MTKHTPGPWVWEERQLDGWSCHGIWSGEEQVLGDNPGWDSRGNLPEEADARLIAAAPDLLDALRETADFIDHESIHPRGKREDHEDCHGCVLVRRARAAIKKAEEGA